MRSLAILLLGVVTLGCTSPEGTEGKTVSTAELNRLNQEAARKDDGIKPPTPPSDGGPGAGR